MSHRRAFCLPKAERAEIISQSEIGAALDNETLALLADSAAAELNGRRGVCDACEHIFVESVTDLGQAYDLCTVDWNLGRA